ncbi:MAG: hypothetical protein ACFFDR_04750 [Candidatus Thorarchaeota archaeon]
MKPFHNTSRIQIPPTLSVEYLISSLEIGHGYSWTRLLSSPKLIIHGKPPLGDLPEVLIYGKSILLENGDEYLLRFRRMLQALAQQSQIVGGR